MRRRLNREDLLSGGLVFAPELQQPFSWPVFGRYELIKDQDGPDPLSRGYLEDQLEDLIESTLEEIGASHDRKHLYFKVAEDHDSVKFYEPLTDVPHLFLEFARAGEKEDQEALSEWVAKYGLLGLHPRQPHAPRWPGGRDHEYDPAGGPGETLLRVQIEAWNARDALAFWEAALSRDKEQLEEAILGRPETLHLLEESRQVRKTDFESRAKSWGMSYADALLDLAVVGATTIVQDALKRFAYPSLEIDVLQQPLDARYGPEQLRRTWEPRNLLGAMYLQFYWLITSAGDLSRCKHCGRFLSYAPPISGSGEGRKPRKDKKFCDKRCQQSYHYHNRIKPERS